MVAQCVANLMNMGRQINLKLQRITLQPIQRTTKLIACIMRKHGTIDETGVIGCQPRVSVI